MRGRPNAFELSHPVTKECILWDAGPLVQSRDAWISALRSAACGHLHILHARIRRGGSAASPGPSSPPLRPPTSHPPFSPAAALDARTYAEALQQSLAPHCPGAVTVPIRWLRGHMRIGERAAAQAGRGMPSNEMGPKVETTLKQLRRDYVRDNVVVVTPSGAPTQ